MGIHLLSTVILSQLLLVLTSAHSSYGTETVLLSRSVGPRNDHYERSSDDLPLHARSPLEWDSNDLLSGLYARALASRQIRADAARTQRRALLDPGFPASSAVFTGGHAKSNAKVEASRPEREKRRAGGGAALPDRQKEHREAGQGRNIKRRGQKMSKTAQGGKSKHVGQQQPLKETGEGVNEGTGEAIGEVTGKTASPGQDNERRKKLSNPFAKAYQRMKDRYGRQPGKKSTAVTTKETAQSEVSEQHSPSLRPRPKEHEEFESKLGPEPKGPAVERRRIQDSTTTLSDQQQQLQAERPTSTQIRQTGTQTDPQPQPQQQQQRYRSHPLADIKDTNQQNSNTENNYSQKKKQLSHPLADLVNPEQRNSNKDSSKEQQQQQQRSSSSSSSGGSKDPSPEAVSGGALRIEHNPKTQQQQQQQQQQHLLSRRGNEFSTPSNKDSKDNGHQSPDDSPRPHSQPSERPRLWHDDLHSPHPGGGSVNLEWSKRAFGSGSQPHPLDFHSGEKVGVPKGKAPVLKGQKSAGSTDMGSSSSGEGGKGVTKRFAEKGTQTEEGREAREGRKGRVNPFTAAIQRFKGRGKGKGGGGGKGSGSSVSGSESGGEGEGAGAGAGGNVKNAVKESGRSGSGGGGGSGSGSEVGGGSGSGTQAKGTGSGTETKGKGDDVPTKKSNSTPKMPWEKSDREREAEYKAYMANTHPR